MGANDPGAAWLQSEMTEAFEGASILLIEDDPDIRDLLVTLLKLAGFSPTACSTAEQGLEALREQTFDLVLTDYALPNRTGGWLLRQAREEGLLDATPALVVTACPDPTDVPGVEVIQKPFDLDQLVERVRVHLEGDGPKRPRGGRVPPTDDGSSKGSDGQDDCPDPIELILYVSAHLPRSASAVKNIRQALRGYKAGKVTLTIWHLSKDPAKGIRDTVDLPPALVRRSSGPRTFILGHVSSQELLLELIDGCGPQQRAE